MITPIHTHPKLLHVTTLLKDLLFSRTGAVQRIVGIQAAVAARHGHARLASKHNAHCPAALGVAVVPAGGAVEVFLIAALRRRLTIL